MANSSNLSLKFILRALRYRNYRLYFAGQAVSLIGTWMQQIAMSWLVYKLTSSAFLLGLVGFSGQLPTFVLTSIAGVFIDKWNRRNTLLVTQTLAMLQAFVLAFLTLTGRIEVWQLFILSFAIGMVNAFDMPTRQSFVIDIVENVDDLGNAIALNSVMFNGARLVGPSIAGILIGFAGEGVCFLLNGLSFLAIIVALTMMAIKPRIRQRKTSQSLFQNLKEGYKYAFHFAPIRAILLLLTLLSFMGMPYIVLLPIFARDILHGGPYTLGFMMGASGTGALLGAVYLASRKTILGLGNVIVVATALFGTGILGLSFSRHISLSIICMLIAGLGMIMSMASCNTILQTIVDEDKRGRVMGLYSMAFMGMAPFGSLFAGVMARKIGAPYTLVLSGIFCLAGSILFLTRLPLLRKMVRPIYVRMGVIREMPTSLG